MTTFRIDNSQRIFPLTGASAVGEQVAVAKVAAQQASEALAQLNLVIATSPFVYESVADGLAAVAEGGTFWAQTDLATLLYRKVDGEAIELPAVGGEPATFVPNQSLTPGSLAIGDGLRELNGGTGEAGKNNLTFGIGAGSTLGTGHYNLLLGPLVGNQMTDSTVVNTYGGGLGNVGNVGIGMGVFQVANGALDNTAVGVNSQQNLTTGMDNASIGINALRNIEGGSENVALGHGALQHLVGYGTFADGYGHRNTGVGDMAGRFLNGEAANKIAGSTSVYVGARTTSSGNAVENETVIGYRAEGKGSHTVVLGSDTVEATYLKGRVLVGHESGLTKLHVMNPVSENIVADGIAVSRPGAPGALALMSYYAGSDTALFASRYTGSYGQMRFALLDDAGNQLDLMHFDNAGKPSLRAIGSAQDKIANLHIDPTTGELSRCTHAGGWQDYTPTISATTGGVWSAVAVNKARFNRVNGMIFVMIAITLPASVAGFSGNIEITLPTGVADMTTPFSATSHTTGQTLRAMTRPSTSPAQGVIQLATNANGTTIAANAQASITGFYVPA